MQNGHPPKWNQTARISLHHLILSKSPGQQQRLASCFDAAPPCAARFGRGAASQAAPSEVTDALVEGQGEQAVAAIAGLATALATQSSFLGGLANKVVARAFATSANAVLDTQIAGWKRELERRELLIRVRDSVEVLLETVVIQLTRSVVGTSERVERDLGEVRERQHEPVKAP